MGVKYWKPSQSLNGQITLATDSNTGFIAVPFSGKVRAIYTTISAALTTGDETLSFAVTGGTSMGDVVITQSGSAAGDVDTLAVTGNNAVVAGDTIDITTDGANGTAAIAYVTVLFDDVK